MPFFVFFIDFVSVSTSSAMVIEIFFTILHFQSISYFFTCSNSFILNKFLCLLILLVCLTFYLNVDGTVIHSSLACVSLCGSIPRQSMCAQLFWSESRIWCEDRSLLVPGCTGSITLVEEVSLEMEGLEAEPEASWGFYSQWLSPL